MGARPRSWRRGQCGRWGVAKALEGGQGGRGDAAKALGRFQGNHGDAAKALGSRPGGPWQCSQGSGVAAKAAVGARPKH